MDEASNILRVLAPLDKGKRVSTNMSHTIEGAHDVRLRSGGDDYGEVMREEWDAFP